jgi:hypothetical protein
LAVLILGIGCPIVSALALDITLDPNQPGRAFEGIGAVSAGAMPTRFYRAASP